MPARFAIFDGLVCLCLSVVIVAQDSVKVDPPKHYRVGTENDQVRIVKVY